MAGQPFYDPYAYPPEPDQSWFGAPPQPMAAPFWPPQQQAIPTLPPPFPTTFGAAPSYYNNSLPAQHTQPQFGYSNYALNGPSNIAPATYGHTTQSFFPQSDYTPAAAPAMNYSVYATNQPQQPSYIQPLPPPPQFAAPFPVNRAYAGPPTQMHFASGPSAIQRPQLQQQVRLAQPQTTGGGQEMQPQQPTFRQPLPPTRFAAPSTTNRPFLAPKQEPKQEPPFSEPAPSQLAKAPPLARPVLAPAPTARPVLVPAPTARPALAPAPTAHPVLAPAPTARPVLAPAPKLSQPQPSTFSKPAPSSAVRPVTGLQRVTARGSDKIKAPRLATSGSSGPSGPALQLVTAAATLTRRSLQLATGSEIALPPPRSTTPPLAARARPIARQLFAPGSSVIKREEQRKQQEASANAPEIQPQQQSSFGILTPATDTSATSTPAYTLAPSPHPQQEQQQPSFNEQSARLAESTISSLCVGASVSQQSLSQRDDRAQQQHLQSPASYISRPPSSCLAASAASSTMSLGASASRQQQQQPTTGGTDKIDPYHKQLTTGGMSLEDGNDEIHLHKPLDRSFRGKSTNTRALEESENNQPAVTAMSEMSHIFTEKDELMVDWGIADLSAYLHDDIEEMRDRLMDDLAMSASTSSLPRDQSIHAICAPAVAAASKRPPTGTTDRREKMTRDELLEDLCMSSEAESLEDVQLSSSDTTIPYGRDTQPQRPSCSKAPPRRLSAPSTSTGRPSPQPQSQQQQPSCSQPPPPPPPRLVAPPPPTSTTRPYMPRAPRKMWSAVQRVYQTQQQQKQAESDPQPSSIAEVVREVPLEEPIDARTTKMTRDELMADLCMSSDSSSSIQGDVDSIEDGWLDDDLGAVIYQHETQPHQLSSSIQFPPPRFIAHSTSSGHANQQSQPQQQPSSCSQPPTTHRLVPPLSENFMLGGYLRVDPLTRLTVYTPIQPLPPPRLIAPPPPSNRPFVKPAPKKLSSGASVNQRNDPAQKQLGGSDPPVEPNSLTATTEREIPSEVTIVDQTTNKVKPLILNLSRPYSNKKDEESKVSQIIRRPMSRKMIRRPVFTETDEESEGELSDECSETGSLQGAEADLAIDDNDSQLGQAEAEKKFRLFGNSRFHAASLLDVQPISFQFPGIYGKDVPIDVVAAMSGYPARSELAHLSVSRFAKHILKKAHDNPAASPFCRTLSQSALRVLAEFWMTHFISTTSSNTLSEVMACLRTHLLSQPPAREGSQRGPMIAH